MTPNRKHLSLPQVVELYQLSGIMDQVDFSKFYLYSLVTHSTAIEGSTITEVENQLLFDEGIPAQGKPMTEQLMNLDLRDAYIAGYRMIDNKEVLNVANLKKMASAVMRRTGTKYSALAGEFDSSRGDLRLCNVTAGAGGRSYMSYLKVAAKLEDFVRWLSKSREAVDLTDAEACYRLSFEAHYRLVTIHPWVDGNGRTARLLMNMLQYAGRLPQSRILPADKGAYIQALIDAREADDSSLFVGRMIEMLRRDLLDQLDKYEHDTGVDDRINPGDDRINLGYDRINPEDDRIKVVRDRIKERVPNGNTEGLARLCMLLMESPRATAPELAENLNVSVPTVNRWLKALRQAGLLSREGSRKSGQRLVNL